VSSSDRPIIRKKSRRAGRYDAVVPPRKTGSGRQRAGAPAGAAAGMALREYAERGVFRGFAAASGQGGREDFEFRWLAGATFRVRLDPRAKRLTFSDVLPNVPRRSAMDRAFREWVRDRLSDRLPEHRRIDPRRVAVACTNRGGSVSVALALRRGSAAREREDWEYAARKGVSLVNEIFHGFLRGPYYEYMVRNFGEPEE
jgi:hypothetical protein